ncbi:hypothetical protein DBV15_01044 [Temnothorax longispinosus]|uniref:Uncharacterized protein n=1 Tax=Temnothorax longispinosus TaxID=300112 RepID=A0A4S2JAC3_9HYME|nr:hypothetical protein DBV15_01044 [Temnothorax longispinosus]
MLKELQTRRLHLHLALPSGAASSLMSTWNFYRDDRRDLRATLG